VSFKETDILKRSTEVIASEVEDEVVMMSLKNGKYYGLDNIGGDIWKMLEEPQSVIDVCRKLMQEYKVDIDTCKKDVLVFIEDLIEQEIILVD